jgi:uncharacterized membrane-anchored protein
MAAKVPTVTFAFWITKIRATTLGKAGADSRGCSSYADRNSAGVIS